VDLFAYIGETLRRMRKERGKTLDEVGKEAGLGRGQLSRIENGLQEATLTTLSKVLVSQGMSRHEFFHRYEMVEKEAEALERSGGVPLPVDRQEEWPEEVRQALQRVEAFVTAAFLQPRPVAQGTIELGDLVVLFRVVSKNPPQELDGSSGEAPRTEVPQPKPRASAKRPARRRKTR
jgi:transcriptional regulator with XRE-family HTH domain